MYVYKTCVRIDIRRCASLHVSNIVQSIDHIVVQVTTETATGPSYIVEVLLHLTKESARAIKTSAAKPCPRGERGEMQVSYLLTYLLTYLLIYSIS